MAKPCPLYGKAIYLDCLDCEDKPCKAPAAAKGKKRPQQVLTMCNDIDLLLSLRAAQIQAFGFCKAKHLAPEIMQQASPYMIRSGKPCKLLQGGCRFVTHDGKEHMAPITWDCVVAVLNCYKITKTHYDLLRGDARDRRAISNIALYNEGLKTLSTLRDVAMANARAKIIITPELAFGTLPQCLQNMQLQKENGIEVRSMGLQAIKPHAHEYKTFGILQRAQAEYPKIVEVIKQNGTQA